MARLVVLERWSKGSTRTADSTPVGVYARSSVDPSVGTIAAWRILRGAAVVATVNQCESKPAVGKGPRQSGQVVALRLHVLCRSVRPVGPYR